MGSIPILPTRTKKSSFCFLSLMKKLGMNPWLFHIVVAKGRVIHRLNLCKYYKTMPKLLTYDVECDIFLLSEGCFK